MGGERRTWVNEIMTWPSPRGEGLVIQRAPPHLRSYKLRLARQRQFRSVTTPPPSPPGPRNSMAFLTSLRQEEPPPEAEYMFSPKHRH
ncbi:hypothetical protein L209DRAFT_766747 [Thermothelomyces heterothallicus CBS 203.75]